MKEQIEEQRENSRTQARDVQGKNLKFVVKTVWIELWKKLWQRAIILELNELMEFQSGR